MSSENKVTKNKVLNATKWSALTQLAAKIVTPLITVVLARLLSPSEYGVITTITMVISFADIFTDAGFQKYLIQHEFESSEEMENYTNVAFWTNMTVSLVLWGLITLFNKTIAAMVGNTGLGYVLIIAGMQLPMTSFTSIQNALYQRNFELKTVFLVQIIASLIPLVISVPLAMIGFGFWSILIGNLAGALEKAVILTLKSKWKPKLYYNLSALKKMFSFSMYTMGNEICVWMTSWFDSFLVGNRLDSNRLGLYKNSQSLVNQIMQLIQSTSNPVLLSSLSRLQNNDSQFESFYFKAQRILAFLIFPLSVGLFFYRELATSIVLGAKWMDASNIIGAWALASGIRVVFVSNVSILFMAKGKPKYMLGLQLLDLAIIVPVCITALNNGFWTLVYSRAFIRADLVVPSMLLLHFVFKISITRQCKNVIKPLMSTIIMAGAIVVMKMLGSGIIWGFVSIAVAGMVYIFSLFVIARDDLKMLISLVPHKYKQ